MKNEGNNVQLGYCTTLKERLSYGSYFVGQNIFYLFIMQFLMLFYTDYVFLSPAVVGIIFLVARVWDAVNDPMFGIIVDKCNLKRGKFKPWITISTCLIPIAMIFVFALPADMGTSAKIAYAATTYIIFGMLYTICDVPIFALATAMTNNIQERTTIISIGRLAATIAMLVLSIVSMPLVMKMGWTKTAIILSIIGFLVMLPINIFAKERFVEKKEKAMSLKDIFSYLGGNKFLLIFYASTIISGMTNTALTFANYFAKYCLGGEQYIPLVMICTILPMLLFSAVLPFVTKRVDKFYVYVFCIVLNLVLSILSYFVGYHSLVLVLVMTALRGLCMGSSMVMTFMFAADCVEYGEYKTGKRAEGITFSIQTFATKLTGAVAGALGGFVLVGVGYNATLPAQTAATIDGIWKAYILFPLVGIVLSIPVLLMYKLRDKDVQIMALCNQKQLTREEADEKLSKSY